MPNLFWTHKPNVTNFLIFPIQVCIMRFRTQILHNGKAWFFVDWTFSFRNVIRWFKCHSWIRIPGYPNSILFKYPFPLTSLQVFNLCELFRFVNLLLSSVRIFYSLIQVFCPLEVLATAVQLWCMARLSYPTRVWRSHSRLGVHCHDLLGMWSGSLENRIWSNPPFSLLSIHWMLIENRRGI